VWAEKEGARSYQLRRVQYGNHATRAQAHDANGGGRRDEAVSASVGTGMCCTTVNACRAGGSSYWKGMQQSSYWAGIVIVCVSGRRWAWFDKSYDLAPEDGG
jgi:hypothetical protein